jgi:uncharacterized protein YggE
MKRSLLSLIVVAVCLVVAAPTPAPAQAVREGKIRILGRAAIEGVPDYALVRVGISNKASSPSAALDQNSVVARKMIVFSKNSG